MDHADIRGLVTAIHLSVAGLPRSSVGDHHVDARIVRSRIPLLCDLSSEAVLLRFSVLWVLRIFSPICVLRATCG